MNSYKAWLDKDICKEIYLHQKIKEPFCGDCQRFWDSWNELEQKAAIVTGRREYTRYIMEERG